MVGPEDRHRSFINLGTKNKHSWPGYQTGAHMFRLSRGSGRNFACEPSTANWVHVDQSQESQGAENQCQDAGKQAVGTADERGGARRDDTIRTSRARFQNLPVTLATGPRLGEMRGRHALRRGLKNPKKPRASASGSCLQLAGRLRCPSVLKPLKQASSDNLIAP